MHATSQQQTTPAHAARPARYTMREAAKLLGWGEKKLFVWLRDHHVFDKCNLPYQRFIDARYFHVQHGQYVNETTHIKHHYARTDITARGLDWLQKQLPAQGDA